MRTQTKSDIQWIDLAKGICMLIVLYWHIDSSRGPENRFVSIDTPLGYIPMAFTLPLFFTCSGMSINLRNRKYLQFLKKKTRRLLMLFLVFWVFNVGIHILLCLRWGTPMELDAAILFPFTENGDKFYYGVTLWFLLCLIFMYAYYAGIHWLTKGREGVIALGCALCSLAGVTLSRYGINLPMFADTALSNMVFLPFGRLLNSYDLLVFQTDTIKKRLFTGGAGLALISLLLLASGERNYMGNSFECSFVEFVFFGLTGIYATFLICQAIRFIRPINYIGRFSIITLGTHCVIIFPTYHIINHFVDKTSIISEIATFTVVTIICMILSRYLRKIIIRLT